MAAPTPLAESVALAQFKTLKASEASSASIFFVRLSEAVSARNACTVAVSGIWPVRSSVTRRRNSSSDDRIVGLTPATAIVEKISLSMKLTIGGVDPAPGIADGRRRVLGATSSAFAESVCIVARCCSRGETIGIRQMKPSSAARRVGARMSAASMCFLFMRAWTRGAA